MSLGLFAAAIVLLEQHGAISVERLAQLLGVPEDQALAMLLDIHAQGHCTLYQGADGKVQRATWCRQPQDTEA